MSEVEGKCPIHMHSTGFCRHNVNPHPLSDAQLRPLRREYLNYESTRYPHWFGRANRGPSTPARSSAKEHLMLRLEAVQSSHKEILDRYEFLQKRLKLVTHDRDVAKLKMARRRWEEEARHLTKWMWPSLYEDTENDDLLVDEVLVDDLPDDGISWDFLGSQ